MQTRANLRKSELEERITVLVECLNDAEFFLSQAVDEKHKMCNDILDYQTEYKKLTGKFYKAPLQKHLNTYLLT